MTSRSDHHNDDEWRAAIAQQERLITCLNLLRRWVKFAGHAAIDTLARHPTPLPDPTLVEDSVQELMRE